MTTDTPRKRAPKAPPLPYAKKLITAWRNAAEKALKSSYVSLTKLLPEPGVWEALAAAIDSGDVPVPALWRMGETVMDHAPPRVAVDLLRSIPANYTLWYAYRVGAVPLLTRLREDPTAFDALAEASEVARDLADVLRIQSGASPAGSASERVRASVASDWCNNQIALCAASIVGGRVVRVEASRVYPQGAIDALRALGDALLGHAKLIETLAEGHCARIARVEASAYERTLPISPNEAALMLASEALSREETCSFQMTYATLCVVAEKWSVEDLIRAALATKDRARPDGYMVAGSLAILAVWRDPSRVAEVERAIQLLDLSNQASAGVPATYVTLARTDAAWRVAYVTEKVFVPYPSTYSGPIGLVLIAPDAPEKAEELAAKFEESLDWVRLSGVDPLALLAIAEKVGPTMRKGLALPILSALTRTAASAPEAVDALVAFDGTFRDGWSVHYVVALPEDRARAVVQREIAQGRGEHARKALEPLRPALFAAL